MEYVVLLEYLHGGSIVGPELLYLARLGFALCFYENIEGKELYIVAIVHPLLTMS